MPTPVDDDVPVYYSPEDEDPEEEVNLDRRSLLEDEPPREWEPYMPAKTLGQLSEEARKKGEVKIRGVKNRPSKDENGQTDSAPAKGKARNTGKHAAQKPSDDIIEQSSSSHESIEENEPAGRAEQFTTQGRFLRGVGRSLQTHLIAPAGETHTPRAPLDPNQPKQLRKQAKILLILGAINLFAVGFWCGSFIFPNKRVVSSLADSPVERAPGKPRLAGDTSIADAVARVDKSVVNIDSRFRYGYGRSNVMRPYVPMQKFFTPPGTGKPMSSAQPQHLQASGIFVSSDGYILTNNHVIAPGMEIRVTTHDNREFRAVVAGRDPYSDLAVIKVEGANNFPVAPFADMKDVHVGDWAITIGSPDGFDHTVAVGIVSGLNRIVNDYDHHVPMIQTDAIMMPGSSGGPLINIDGKVIGISSVERTVDGHLKGLNFAIPANVAKDVAHELIEKGSIPRPYLGIVLQDYDPDRKKAQSLPSNPVAVLVGKVMAGGPADKMDIRVGDIIVKLNGTPVKSAAEVRSFIKSSKPGDVFELTLRHFNAGEVFLRKITLGNYPVEM